MTSFHRHHRLTQRTQMGNAVLLDISRNVAVAHCPPLDREHWELSFAAATLPVKKSLEFCRQNYKPYEYLFRKQPIAKGKLFLLVTRNPRIFFLLFTLIFLSHSSQAVGRRGGTDGRSAPDGARRPNKFTSLSDGVDRFAPMDKWMKLLFAVVMLDAYYLMMKSIVQLQSLLSELLVSQILYTCRAYSFHLLFNLKN